MTGQPAPDHIELERAAAVLKASGDFRVLRRIKPHPSFNVDDGSEKKIGIVVDVETTGLDSYQDEIIEIGMLSFEFSSDGRIFSLIDQFESFNAPAVPISDEITNLTGITAKMVRGKKIPWKKVGKFVSEAAVVIAHNAAFDRRFLERCQPAFKRIPWACSATDVAWAKEGVEGLKLGYILANFGLFHDGHRALEDCLALVHVLAHNLPKAKTPVLKQLLDNARQPVFRVWAEGTPFGAKDILKRRGYRWSDGMGSRPKAWWRDLLESAVDSEISFLETEVYGGPAIFRIQRITAFDRYSERA